MRRDAKGLCGNRAAWALIFREAALRPETTLQGYGYECAHRIKSDSQVLDFKRVAPFVVNYRTFLTTTRMLDFKEFGKIAS
jgi:hypothetical protein